MESNYSNPKIEEYNSISNKNKPLTNKDSKRLLELEDEITKDFIDTLEKIEEIQSRATNLNREDEK